MKRTPRLTRPILEALQQAVDLAGDVNRYIKRPPGQAPEPLAQARFWVGAALQHWDARHARYVQQKAKRLTARHPQPCRCGICAPLTT
jgi:hypothetical protein